MGGGERNAYVVLVVKLEHNNGNNFEEVGWGVGVMDWIWLT